MKRLLISLFAAGALLNVSADIHHDLVPMLDKPAQKKAVGKVKSNNPSTRADENFMFGYCFDDIYNALGLGQDYIGGVLEAAIEIPEELAQQWKGRKVTGVNVGFGYSSNKKVLIYITKDLEIEPVLMQEAVMTVETTADGVNGWNLVTLDKPYTIDGEAFYVGYQSQLAQANDAPIGIDGYPTQNTYADIIGIQYWNTETNQQEMSYGNYGTQFGCVSLKIEIEGSSMPEFNLLPGEIFLPQFVQKDETFTLQSRLFNTGTETIESADVTVKINGETVNNPKVVIYGEGELVDGDYVDQFYIEGGQSGFIAIENLSCPVSGQIPIEITINKVTGPSGSKDINVTWGAEQLVAGTNYDRKFVVEEFTGSWCGWCPRGIVQMAEMEEIAPEDFIGIAVHYNDKMEAPTYSTYAESFYYYPGPGFPSASFNRQYVTDTEPSSAPNWQEAGKGSIPQWYEVLKDEKIPMKIEVQSEYNQDTNTLTATAITTFGFDMQKPPYSVTFVLTENNVGPFSQTNYYAGGQHGPLDGWENKGGNVATIYNEVARFITGIYGLENSMMEEVKEGVANTFTQDLPLTELVPPITNAAGNGTLPFDLNNCHLIALLLDASTGEIMNGAKMSLEGMAGVESIIDDPYNGIYKVYNPQGLKVLETTDVTKVNSLPHGIYIVNGKKVVI